MSQQTGCVSGIVQLTIHLTLGVYNNYPPLARYMLLRWPFCLFWALCTHAQLNPFYHTIYPNVTHVRERYQALSHFSVLIVTVQLCRLPPPPNVPKDNLP